MTMLVAARPLSFSILQSVPLEAKRKVWVSAEPFGDDVVRGIGNAPLADFLNGYHFNTIAQDFAIQA